MGKIKFEDIIAKIYYIPNSGYSISYDYCSGKWVLVTKLDETFIVNKIKHKLKKTKLLDYKYSEEYLFDTPRKALEYYNKFILESYGNN